MIRHLIPINDYSAKGLMLKTDQNVARIWLKGLYVTIAIYILQEWMWAVSECEHTVTWHEHQLSTQACGQFISF